MSTLKSQDFTPQFWKCCLADSLLLLILCFVLSCLLSMRLLLVEVRAPLKLWIGFWGSVAQVGLMSLMRHLIDDKGIGGHLRLVKLVGAQ